MNISVGNNEIKNPFLKILIAIIAIIIVLAVIGFIIGIVLPSIAIILVGVLIFVALVVPIATVFGMGKWMKGVRGSGDLLTEIRDIKEFKTVKIGVPATISIKKSDVVELTISADDNLLGYILTYVSDGELNIYSENSLVPKNKINITLATPTIEGIKISGVTKAIIDCIKSENFTISCAGAANITANGKVVNLSTNVSGTASLHLKELKSEHCSLEVNGASKGEFYASKSLKARINGTGKAIVWGSPTDVDKNINGLGKITIK